MFKAGEIANPHGRNGKEDAEYYDVLTALKAAGHNHIQAIVDIATDIENVKVETRLKANEILLARTSPILKSVEQKMDDGLQRQFRELKDTMIAIAHDYRREF